MSFSTKDAIIFLIVVAFATANAQPAINSDFSTSNNLPFIPVEAWSTASGYYNGAISLIGGLYTPRTVIEYDIEAETFTTTTQSLPTSVGFDGTSSQFNQFWVQNGVNVYIINPAGTALQVYDLSTKTLTDNIAEIPIRVQKRACIASARDTLYILGGGAGGSGTAADDVLNTVQRFDIRTSQWLQTKYMLVYRRELSCIYSPTNDALYAIGGWDDWYDLDSVEYVTVSDIETSAFQFTRTSLSFGLTNAFAVVYGAEVYILGGVTDNNDYWTYRDVVHILDTATNIITVSPHRLAYPVISPSGIVAENVMYLFGGEVAEKTATNKWQFYVFSLPSTTIWNITPSQATTTTSQQSNEAGQAAESDAIWIPVIIFLATATIVCCMCLVFCLIMKGKENDHDHGSQPCPQASQAQNHVQNKGIPAQPPMYVQGIPSYSFNIQPMPVQATSTAADNMDVAAEHKTEIDIANENMVREWFAYTVGLPHFADLFIANGYENMHLIRGMQEQDLVAIGVRTIYHKQQIVNAIRALNEFYEQGRVMHGEYYNTGNGECVANDNVNEGKVQTNGNVAIAEDEFVVHGDDDGIVENGQTDSRR